MCPTSQVPSVLRCLACGEVGTWYELDERTRDCRRWDCWWERATPSDLRKDHGALSTGYPWRSPETPPPAGLGTAFDDPGQGCPEPSTGQ